MGKYQNHLLLNQKKKTSAIQELAYYKEMLKVFNQNKDFKELDSLLEKTPSQKLSHHSSDDGKVSEHERKEYVQYMKKNHKKGFYDSVKPQIENLPSSNGTKYFQKSNVSIGIIADEFLYKSLKDAANFIYIHQGNYKKEAEKIDLFLLSTAWKGLDGKWKGLGNPKIKKVRNEIKAIIQFYKSKNIPVIFYSKEDPVNYEYYVDLAQQADHIFTTCSEKLQDYKKDCPNATSYNTLEFAVNPLYHNPIGTRINRREDILFAGSWYQKYPSRQEDTRELFEGVINAGRDLTIVDRNFELESDRHFYPKEYVPFIVESTDHETLQKIHKLYDFTLNLNSVKDSNTMFANRVYELQATGTVVISNYSVGINSKFPNVFLANTSEELKVYLQKMSKREMYQTQMEGVRTVLRSETAFHRVQELIQVVSDHQTNLLKRKVLVVAESLDEHIIEMFNKQSYPDKKLISQDEVTEELYRSFDIVACFSNKYEYGQFYLEDMINAFKYTNCDYITKDAYEHNGELTKGVEHNYIEKIEDRFRTVFWSDSFNWEDIKSISNATIPNGYSVDPLELSVTSNDVVRSKQVREYDLSVIIPIYNNGRHLLYKCFKSLQRSSIFEQMEIILVDDGSTDNMTPYIVQALDKHFDNVKMFMYPQGGSGSASRPRNKGLEFASAKWVTYLDPDNEAITDGYKELLDSSLEEDHDMFIGNMVRLSDIKGLSSYYPNMMSLNDGIDYRHAPHSDFLIKASFKAMSIQALIVKRDLLLKNQLKMVEGAIGEDTLFFHEMLMKTKSFKVLNTPVHIYYAMVENSSINRINKKFFEKYLVLEKERIDWLKRENLLVAYKKDKLENYVDNWYLKKFSNIEDEDRSEAKEILKNILKLYEGMKWKNDKIIEFLKD
ncbi:glycosyltransferase [Bacillus zhangzhouensis]|uniref:glycosyltransferase n=1 Tax=Bacillus zhangzhouensis TaxID=1178540 RepID=UPI002813001B|nr:glycosyltransferase [Bacillus zhangzhouensis]MDR0123762.1 glycosyltransferase [Bacillus zhangzhouensis]